MMNYSRFIVSTVFDISVSITQLLTGTTNDLFLHESSKPFHRWPLIFQTIFFPARRPWRITSRTAKTWHPISIFRGYRGSKSIYGEEKLFPIVRSEEYLSFVLFWERRFVDRPLKEWKWHRITRDPYLKPERFFLQSTSKRKSVKLTVSLHIWKIILWFYPKHFRFKLYG